MPSRAPSVRQGSGKREIIGHVLIVDDDPASVDALRDILEEASYVVRSAADGVEALAALRRESISVLLLKERLPVMNGAEFRRRQLADPALATVPVIMFTDDAQAAVDGVCLLVRPFDRERLLSMIEGQRKVASRNRAGRGDPGPVRTVSSSALAKQNTVAAVPHDADTVPSKTTAAAGAPLGPVERFVLEQIDGRRSVEDLAALVSLTTAEVASIVRRLVELGAVEGRPAAEPAELDDGWEESPLLRSTCPPPKASGDS